MNKNSLSQVDLVIRAATTTDLEALNEMMYCLHDEHHQMYAELFKPADQIEKSIAHYIDHPECLVLVAEHQQQVIAFVSGYFGQYQSPVSQPVLMGSIDELYVLSAYRRFGVGAQLLERMQRDFTHYGAKYLFVEVWDSNTAGVEFYRRLGFVNHIHCLAKPLT
ncbi:GNAT family N-acetyltransferase [Vibrio agarivorans]|uniref:GNAT family N-acetyltransferase n=1 Tax=Vibrio agarivorans TaxID=153622 RepID=UPI0025B4EA17|nr:GNAT family N-acetyltransferase [Vibrio agarivorans]MDN3663232.1 GNAT family N-acetyltransferase [Vibrio agarivorans]